MNYEGQICRAPMERASFMLPVMVGCSYNRCKFCNLFRHLKYRELPMEEIENELKRVQVAGGKPKKIFLGDGNAFGLRTGHLLEILELIRTYFPECECVNMDATVTSILNKSDEELRLLYEMGVRHLYLGIESGLDDVLLFMKKDHNLEQAYEAIGRLQKVGLIYDAHIMTGVAGKGRSMENAEALAHFLNSTHPAHVVNFSMFLHKEVPLFEDVENGNYIPADELECICEERHLIELLDEEMLYDGFHDFIQVRTRGKIPADKEKMLAKLTKVVEEYKEREPIYAYVQGECPDLEKCDGLKKVWDMRD
ncbi:radical SAM protein [Roseburia hominis]